MPETVIEATCCWCGTPLRVAGLQWWCPTEVCNTRQRRHAVGVPGSKAEWRWYYVPLPKQVVWHESVYDRTKRRVLVGGAAGPGKSKFLREQLYRFAKEVPGLHAILLRRTFKDLDKSHLRFMPFEVAQRGGDYKATDKLAVFKQKGQPDSIIRAGHMENDADVTDHLSAEYDVIAPDEIVTFDRDPMLELFSRARSTNPTLKALRGMPGPEGADGSLVLTATNPGGRGALWVRDFFVTKEPGDEFPDYDPSIWSFHDAKIVDNPYISRQYAHDLLTMPEIRKRQLLYGDWSAFEGQFFTSFEPTRKGLPWHVVERPVPRDVEWFCSMDWGYNAPGVILWWACLPDGHYHIAKELKFQYDPAESVAQKWRHVNRELGLSARQVRYIAADPSMWAKTGHGRGESIAETLLRLGLPMRRSDNDRKLGWQRCHEMFREAPDGTPWLTIDARCRYGVRTLPAQVQDKNNPDDLDTSKDDHWCDAKRYGAMSRPSPTRLTPKQDRFNPMLEQFLAEQGRGDVVGAGNVRRTA